MTRAKMEGTDVQTRRISAEDASLDESTDSIINPECLFCGRFSSLQHCGLLIHSGVERQGLIFRRVV